MKSLAPEKQWVSLCVIKFNEYIFISNINYSNITK